MSLFADYNLVIVKMKIWIYVNKVLVSWQVPFIFWGKGMGLIIKCPKCGNEVLHNAKGTMNIAVKCCECNKLVIWKPTEGQIVVKNIPIRQSSSGVRFY